DKGNAKLYAKLKKIDPLYASKIHPNDTRRVVRALEVYKLTGKPFSAHHKETKGLKDNYAISIFILNRNREKLYDRINKRVDKMFRCGVTKEVKRLRRFRLSKTAKAVLGFSEISAYLKGEATLEETKELLKMNTRRYAKRQLTWFRREKGALWKKL
ncbi:MAG: tRNA (adenosine(37)-N6)-dimethylallyltransferase MiaA, partial [Candidatus Omnitrophica bacterium]|nr:tRNA (adenosine(37)-N6)-dimethylallyltransferase MiaA [Candidatus Omnitrophota bacterium]